MSATDVDREPPRSRVEPAPMRPHRGRPAAASPASVSRARWLRRGAAGAVVLPGLAWAFWPSPMQVEGAAAEVGSLVVTVEAEGATRLRDVFVVAAPIAGRVRRIEFRPGDRIEAGAVIAWIDAPRSAPLDSRLQAELSARGDASLAELARAERGVDAAAASAEHARAQLGRVEVLFSAGAASAQQLEEARTEATLRAAELASARSAVVAARASARATRAAAGGEAASGSALAVRAPAGGTILRLPRRSEGPVQLGETLAEVGETWQIEVEADVLSTDVVRIAPGSRVRFEGWGGAAPLEGVVRRVEPEGRTRVSALGVEEQRVAVVADIASPREEWERLGPGYRVTAHFEVWRGDRVLTVPNSALVHDEGGWAVLQVRNGRAVRRPVRIGERNDLRAQVLEGVEPGDVVVTYPGEGLREGARVEVTRTARE